MAVTPLASLQDVVNDIGRPLTPDEVTRATVMLEKASELFRREAQQHFTEGESHVQQLVGSCGTVKLAERPVLEVHEVTADRAGAPPLRFDRFKQELTVHGVRAGERVRVRYSHGGDVPDLVRLRVAEIVRKVLGISKKATEGVTQYSTTTGPMTDAETYASWAQGGQTMLAPDDAKLARSYRSKRRGAIVTSAS